MSEFTHRLPHQPWRKPSKNEQEYFRRREFRERMEEARKREARRADSEREELLARHRGHCPKCGGTLEPMETPEGMAAQCPACLGVWMDRQTFDRLTQPGPKNEYLTGIFREMFLQYTTGSVKPPSRRKEKGR